MKVTLKKRQVTTKERLKLLRGKREPWDTHQLQEFQRKGKWYWRIRENRSGKVVAHHGQGEKGYDGKSTMRRAFDRLARAFAENRIARHGV